MFVEDLAPAVGEFTAGDLAEGGVGEFEFGFRWADGGEREPQQ